MAERVEGELAVGEASSVALQVQRRVTGLPWPTWVYSLCIPIGGIAAAFVQVSLTGTRNWIFGFLMGVALVWVLGRYPARAWALARFRKRLAERGVSGPMPTSFDLTPEALVWSVEGITKSAHWDVVSEVFPAGPYWIFVAQSEAAFLPRRFFASPADQRAFLTRALAYMGEAARGRSSEAREFLAGG